MDHCLIQTWAYLFYIVLSIGILKHGKVFYVIFCSSNCHILWLRFNPSDSGSQIHSAHSNHLVKIYYSTLQKAVIVDNILPLRSNLLFDIYRFLIASP